MSEQTTQRSSADALWRTVIIGIFVVGVLVAVGYPLMSGNWRGAFMALPVFAFGILIAAIRSIRH